MIGKCKLTAGGEHGKKAERRDKCAEFKGAEDFETFNSVLICFTRNS